MSIKIQGNISGNISEVDSNSNLKINLPTTQSQAGFSTIQTQQDAGSIIGSRNIITPESSLNNRLKVGLITPIFNEYFQGANLNSAQWNSNVTTMTVTTAGGFLNLNAGASAASAAVARVQSYRQLQFSSIGVLNIEILMQLSFTPVANNIVEWGIGYATGTTAPTDGVFFRLNTAGSTELVVNNNGSETVVTVTSGQFAWAANTSYHTKIFISEDAVVFMVNSTFLALISRGVSAGIPASSNQLPILLRTYNSSAATSGQQLKVAAIEASSGDTHTSKPWPHIMAGSGLMGYQGQTGGTMGTTALYSNSLAAGAGAVMTNTAASLGSGLGGQFSALPTLAAGTDGIISSYQNPVGTAALPSKTLYITGVKIQGCVTTVLVGNATPVLYAYSIAFGHTVVSLATAEAATTKAPRRIALGYETYAAAAAVGTVGTGVSMTFNSPIVVNPGEFIQLVGKNIGAVTTTGVITFSITFDSYWE